MFCFVFPLTFFLRSHPSALLDLDHFISSHSPFNVRSAPPPPLARTFWYLLPLHSCTPALRVPVFAHTSTPSPYSVICTSRFDRQTHRPAMKTRAKTVRYIQLFACSAEVQLSW
ncbi:hypothetical protein CALCODRAFT_341144 [Calocera cornea HHB12733]|uniref:Uncharacterized protein n=1 Tax=Calocera cornea HHB12733 TaxID=1353952 RepID=A0A165EY91_9BASI|nr:hypothetical protein CALCODRAFT_341144 [Calocera cornea HHB12733]